jgi:hypothetical protein
MPVIGTPIVSESGKHAQRFKRWKERAAPCTRVLAEEIISRWVPAIEARGFDSVDCILGKPDSPVEGRDIQFERWSDGYIDVIHLFFDKYSSPRFQISFARRELSSPNRIIRASHLVRRSSEYYHEWGKARWLPAALWSQRQSAATVDAVLKATEQIFTFLETGEVGPNIGRD